MTKTSEEGLRPVQELAIELLAAIDAWRDLEDDPGHFRHRLLRAHAVAVLDELEQIAAGRARVARTESRRAEP
jgi:hypothetical protein